jgi:hypothetical protein
MEAGQGSPPADPKLKFKLPPVGFYFKRYILYETKTRLFLIGRNATKTQYRILKIDRTQPTGLSIVEDDAVYSRNEITDFLSMQDLANKPMGVRKLASAYGIIGFVRFMSHYYIYLITKQKLIGTIGAHRVYSIEETMNIPVPHPMFQEATPEDEDRYRTLFFRFDLTQDFYYSPTYPLTYTLQYNMVTPLRPARPEQFPSYNDIFAWNHYLLEPLYRNVTNEHWIVPIIHGSFVQSHLDVVGRNLQLTVIARRSRLFAGARFQKRGIDEQGHVANDVEVEQILADPGMGLYSPSSMSSYVQHRGSIPLYWAQISGGGVIPKPPISIQRADPFYSSSILHFMDLMKRYGSPLIVLNLIKSRESVPREMILRDAYGKCLDFINSSITDESKRIVYIAWDFKKAAKNNKSKLQRDMYSIAQMSILRTGFFHADSMLYSNELRQNEEENHHSGDPDTPNYGDPSLKNGDAASDHVGRLQHGAVRTNCIDSIDRTNAAQYLIGLCALSHQLYSMGIIQSPNELTFDSAISLVLMEMYEIAGHQLALQYGGSGLAHTMNTFVTKSIVDHSKDFWTVVQRYYRNTFTDQEKQNTINVFLGVFRPWEHRYGPDLWSLESDYHLHINDRERELIYASPWWVEPLQQHQGIYRRTKLPTLTVGPEETTSEQPVDVSFEDFYQIHKLSSFDKLLGSEFKKPRKAAVAIANASQSPKSERGEEKAGLGIMRWLWSSKSPSPSPSMSRSASLGQVGLAGLALRHLDWCGMDIVDDATARTIYAGYCEAFADWKRLMKKRKRYNYYKRQNHLTHHRKPKIGTGEYHTPSTHLYESLVHRWTHNITVSMPSDIDMYTAYQSIA